MRSEVQARMFALLQNKSSSQDVTSFCTENNIAKASYYYWMRKMKEGRKASVKQRFVPVTLLPQNAPLISLQLPGGIVINVFDREAFPFIESLLG